MRIDTTRMAISINAVLVTLLLLGCDKTGASVELDRDVGLSEYEQAGRMPFKGEGYWQVIQSDPGCGGSENTAGPNETYFVNLMDLGRAVGHITYCWGPGELAFVEGTFTTANGDEVFVYDSKETGAIYSLLPPDYGEYGPLQITGGTGRFEHAAGMLFMWGSAAGNAGSGKIMIDGWISISGSVE